jgi:hypothetical protein
VRFRVTTWPEGFEVEANDEEHALVTAQLAIARDAYLLVAVAEDVPVPPKEES